MNSCCTLPAEVIAADEHKKGGECCLVTEHTSAPAKAECPMTKTSSRKVQRKTVEHLLKPESSHKLRDVQYYYCTDEACDVVYFSNEKAPTVSVSDVNVKVFTKDQGDDVNVCYCFTWTRGRIKNQIAELGKSTAAFEIAREVKAGDASAMSKIPRVSAVWGM